MELKQLPKALCNVGILTIGLVATIQSAYAEKFTIAVISDTQNYVDASLPQPRGIDTIKQQMQYLVDTREAKNLVFATHVGDVVQHGDGQFRTGPSNNRVYWNTKQEWIWADEAMGILTNAGVPFGILPGNHDFDNYSWYTTGPNDTPGPGASRPLQGGSAFRTYFGPNSRHFAGKSWYGGSYEMNSWQVFSAGGYKFLNLSLEQEPRLETLSWAQTVLDSNPGIPTIVTTHEWADPNFTGAVTRSNDYNSYFPGTTHQTPDQVWDSFIRKNDQIFMTLSGHDFRATPNQPGVSNGELLRIDNNDFGHPVYQVVQDYQGNTVGPDGTPGSAAGGAGWLRFIEFDTETKEMHFYTYSTLLDKYAGRNGESTFGVPPEYSDFKLSFTPQVVPVPEPGTYVLMLAGLGLVGLVIRGRGRRV